MTKRSVPKRLSILFICVALSLFLFPTGLLAEEELTKEESAQLGHYMGSIYGSLFRGSYFEDKASYEAALESADEALKTLPEEKVNFSPIYELKGRTLLKLERFDEAIGVLKKSVEADTQNFDAWAELGIAYNYLEQFDDSVAVFKKALEIKPDYFEQDLGELELLYYKWPKQEAIYKASLKGKRYRF